MDDPISRQAAIKIIKNYCENGCDIAEDNWCPSCQREQFIKLLEALPSAQPEPSQVARDIATIIENEQDMRVMLSQPEDCDTCKHGYFGDSHCDNCRVRYPSHYERRTDGH